MSAPVDDPYITFLRGKMQLAKADGFDVAPDDINPAGAPHCRAIVRWARAIPTMFDMLGIGESDDVVEAAE